MFADKNNLGRAFANLIKNAVQAIGNKPQGSIDIQLKSMDDRVVISIEDNGKGMNVGEQKRVLRQTLQQNPAGWVLVYPSLTKSYGLQTEQLFLNQKKAKEHVFVISLPLYKGKVD